MYHVIGYNEVGRNSTSHGDYVTQVEAESRAIRETVRSQAFFVAIVRDAAGRDVARYRQGKPVAS